MDKMDKMRAFRTLTMFDEEVQVKVEIGADATDIVIADISVLGGVSKTITLSNDVAREISQFIEANSW